mmetsp:Transcript_10924/g.33246  ORF Transcript_10924/g.33246 Transcript_10924/m.33246 type:complete len:246 (-) Transcript_10924:1423-2160(-)
MANGACTPWTTTSRGCCPAAKNRNLILTLARTPTRARTRTLPRSRTRTRTRTQTRGAWAPPLNLNLTLTRLAPLTAPATAGSSPSPRPAAASSGCRSSRRRTRRHTALTKLFRVVGPRRRSSISRAVLLRHTIWWKRTSMPRPSGARCSPPLSRSRAFFSAQAATARAKVRASSQATPTACWTRKTSPAWTSPSRAKVVSPSFLAAGARGSLRRPILPPTFRRSSSALPTPSPGWRAGPARRCGS